MQGTGYLCGNILLWPKYSYLISYLQTFVEASYMNLDKIYFKVYGINGKVHFWPYVNYNLSQNNMFES